MKTIFAAHGSSGRSRSRSPAVKTTAQPASGRRWLLLVHQLPATPSNLRVRTWRRLQELGAVALKQAVYVLPDSAETREDFEWLKVEIEGSGGEASVMAADNLDPAADAALIEEFRRSRQSAYAELAADLQRVHRAAGARKGQTIRRSPRGSDHLEKYRQRFAAIERVDFFGSAGRDRVVALIAELEAAAAAASGKPAAATGAGVKTASFQGRLWLTRPRPGIDRMGSAWLIRRFIDPGARFGFITDAKAAAPDAVAFDMFGVDFSHHGDRCTFETLRDRFDLRDAAVDRLATIVHDLDLKDNRFGAPEAATLAATIEGLQLACDDDAALLEQGMTMFEALYRSFTQASRPPGPSPVTRPRPKRPRRK